MKIIASVLGCMLIGCKSNNSATSNPEAKLVTAAGQNVNYYVNPANILEEQFVVDRLFILNNNRIIGVPMNDVLETFGPPAVMDYSTGLWVFKYEYQFGCNEFVIVEFDKCNQVRGLQMWSANNGKINEMKIGG